MHGLRCRKAEGADQMATLTTSMLVILVMILLWITSQKKILTSRETKHFHKYLSQSAGNFKIPRNKRF